MSKNSTAKKRTLLSLEISNVFLLLLLPAAESALTTEQTTAAFCCLICHQH